MNTIDVQAKTWPGIRRIDHRWFENQYTGLTRTRFHRITIPLEPFDSGLSYVPQPERTSISIDWINLDMADPDQLDGVELRSQRLPSMEASVYVG